VPIAALRRSDQLHGPVAQRLWSFVADQAILAPQDKECADGT